MIEAGWRGALGAIRQNPVLVMFALFVTLLVAAVTQPMFPPVHFHRHSSHYPAPMSLHLVFLGTVQTVLFAIIAAPCMVATHRFVLIGEHNKTLSSLKRIVYFIIWITAFRLLPQIIALAMDRIYGTSIIIIVVYYVMVRLVMSFPAVALDVPHPIRDSWKRTKGHWWDVFWTMVWGLAPGLIIVVPIAMGAPMWVHVIFVSVAGLMMSMVGAALASELYRKLGGLIPESAIVA